MAYNIAANQRRVSPVQEMLQARDQTDRHQLNRLRIERAETEMPYVKELMEQKVTRGGQAIERERIQQKYLEQDIQKRQQMMDYRIDEMAYQGKQRQKAELFNKALKSGADNETLRKQFPEMYYQHRQTVLENETAELQRGMQEIAVINQLPPDQREDAWIRAMSDAPPELRGVPYDEQTVAKLDRAINQQFNTAISEYMELYDSYKESGNEELAGFARRALEKALSTAGGYGSLSKTQKERMAKSMFGWAKNPMAAMDRYNNVKDNLEWLERRQIARSLQVDAQDVLLGAVGSYQQIADPEAREKIRRGLNDPSMIGDMKARALAEMDEDDRNFYLYAKQQIAEQSQPVRPPVGPASDEPGAGGVPLSPAEMERRGIREPDRQSSYGPEVGSVHSGYRFLGGDPSDESNWQQVE